jgi:hypothetical protein
MAGQLRSLVILAFIDVQFQVAEFATLTPFHCIKRPRSSIGNPEVGYPTYGTVTYLQHHEWRLFIYHRNFRGIYILKTNYGGCPP